MSIDLSAYIRPPKAVETPAAATQAPSAPSAELTDEARRLLVSLETRVALTQSAARYPRVLNRIATAWSRPAELERALNDLLLDARGNRQGFPPEVVTELASLRDYLLTRVLPKTDPWERMHLR
jgi:hypothetical protein